MKKAALFITVFVIGIVCGLIFSYGSIHAQGAVSEGDVMSKLNAIAKSQEDMAGTLNSIKEDLQIVKIRVTQMQ